MPFPKDVFVYEPGGETSYPSSTKFTWQPRTKDLGPEPGATPELLEELLATGLVDETARLNISEWNKKLFFLPDSITRLTSLCSMQVNTSQFDGWDNLYRLGSLQILVLGEKVSGDLPEGISRLENLEKLTISGKRITSLPADLGGLKRLKTLTIANTKLAELPDSVCELTGLETLVLSWARKIKKLPEGMEQMESLRHLKTDFLPLATIPAGLARHPGLRTLEIFNGKVKKLPDVSWPKLEQLDLQGPLSRWPAEFAAPKLRTVRLGDKFKTLPALPAESLEDLYVNAPLMKLDPSLASVAKLDMQCSKAAYEVLSDSERSAFGDRLKATWD